MSGSNPAVDAFIANLTLWRPEAEALRRILLDSGLAEEMKWNKPCYTHAGHNIAIIQPFRDYCALLFFKGALLEDPDGILQKTGEHTRVGRQIRVTSTTRVADIEPGIRACIADAVEVEKSGRRVEPAASDEVPVPVELETMFTDDDALESAFYSLTPGRRRAYLYFFSTAKQSKTRKSRIEQCVPKIMEGKGLRD